MTQNLEAEQNIIFSARELCIVPGIFFWRPEDQARTK
jgi:hypothetical protein